MDLATLLGLLIGVLFILLGILSTDMAVDNLLAFWDPASLFIVGGGTMAAVMISFPLRVIRNSWRVAAKAFLYTPPDPRAQIAHLVGYAETARRSGTLALEQQALKARDPFLKRGLLLAVDGTDPALIDEILTEEMNVLAERHNAGRRVFESLARYAPAWGMIGTLIGLVLMLMEASHRPDRMGAGLATALLTTFYGAVAANFLFGPIADKLGKRSEEELLDKRLIMRGIIAIQNGDNPRVIREKLRAYLPPASVGRLADERPAPPAPVATAEASAQPDGDEAEAS